MGAARTILRAIVALSAVWLIASIVIYAVTSGATVKRPQFESAGLVFGVAILLLSLIDLWIAGARRRAAPAAPPPAQAAHTPIWLILLPGGLAAAAFLWTLGLGPLS